MTHLTSRKGRVGVRVRVCELHSVPDMLRGLAGTIKQSCDHPDHAAYDVLLDGRGSTQLFWYYQLKDEAPKGTLRQRRPPTIHRSA